jgi:hypothetical protein
MQTRLDASAVPNNAKQKVGNLRQPIDGELARPLSYLGWTLVH